MSFLSGALFLLLIFYGTPLFVVIATSAISGFYFNDIDLQVIAVEIYRLAEMPVLSAIPLFTFAGYLLGEGQASQRLVRLSNAIVGWMPGGIAVVALCTFSLFTAFTGASGVAIIALGAFLLPALRKVGFDDRFNFGLISSSGSLGLLFAPSLPLILYAVVAQQLALDTPVSIDQLFIAGILPGMLMIAVLSTYAMIKSQRLGLQTQPFNARELLCALRESSWEIPLPFIILGGIYSGFFAVSEAAAVTATYVLITEMLLRRDISLQKMFSIMRESMILVGAIMIILGVSLASTNYIIDADIPTKLFEIISTHISNKYTFLLLLTLFLLILGMMLDIFSAIVLMIPIILPVAIAYDIHPIHLGILFLANMQLGYFTPPVGMNLFIASHRFNQPVIEIYKATIPFFIILLATVLLITFVPLISLLFVAPSLGNS